MSKNTSFLILVIFITLIAGLFVYPKGDIFGVKIGPLALGQKFMPWRLGLDIVGGSHLTWEVDLSKVALSDQQSVLSGLRDIMEARINSFGVSEPNVIISNSGGRSNLVVELAGINDPAQAIAQIGRTAFLEFREVNQKEVDGKTQVELISTDLNGKYLTSAKLTTDNLGQPEIAINFNSDGDKIFADLTEKNIGKPLAILIDGQVISSPTVKQRISGGNAVVTGVNDFKEAQGLVSLLNAGALPAPIRLVSQSTIGATLGSEFLNKAIEAGALGTLIIIIFVSLYYRSLGVFASFALLIYIILTLSVFKGISITMSLSGIAGFILSIGMAVDANILIFERTKEEIKKGLSRVSAVEEGFHRAWPSIRDSNFSTLITSAILYFFTSSFVQGFALTLAIGVFVSMFSAITLTRALLRASIK